MNFLNFFRNKKGQGLIAVMIAAGLVVLVSLAVSRLIGHYHSQSNRLETSNECQQIANQVYAYLLKDNNSLVISSFGSALGTKKFAMGLDKTDDGLDRFAWSGAIDTWETPGGSITVDSNSNGVNPPFPTLSAGWGSHNYLNIKNSLNRLIILASSGGNFCCDPLNPSDISCGAKYYSNVSGALMSRQNLNIAGENVTVDLGVDIFKNGTSLCGGVKDLALGDLPIAQDISKVNAQFFIRTYLNKGTPNEKVCNANGRVQGSLDNTATLTLLEIQNSPTKLCGGSILNSPSNCGNGDISIKVQTVKDKNSTTKSCQTQCLQKISPTSCGLLGSVTASYFSSVSNATCMANCEKSEPGSFFLCRIGEHNWMQNNPNVWEPCEMATVHTGCAQAGDPVPKVTIEYTQNGVQTTDTEATISLSNLVKNRAYDIDVRAVDTAGNVGPSFGSFCQGESCSDAMFTVIDNIAPTDGALSEESGYVDMAGKEKGATTTVISQPQYSSAMGKFSGQFQCQSGSLKVTMPVDYSSTPTGCYNVFNSEQCQAKLDKPGTPGTYGNISCVCYNGGCTALPKIAADDPAGSYLVSMYATNECSGKQGAIKTLPWCYDNIKAPDGMGSAPGAMPMFTVSSKNYDNLGTTVAENKNITGITGSVCGAVTMCPNLTGNPTPVLAPTTCVSPVGWSETANSGCLQDPSGNFCAMALDPCGRYAETAVVSYSTKTKAVPWSTTPATSGCYNYSGVQVDGNVCAAGFCAANGSCFNSKPPTAASSCAGDADCDDNKYCVTHNDSGGPECIGGVYECDVTAPISTSGFCTKAEYNQACTVSDTCKNLTYHCSSPNQATSCTNPSDNSCPGGPGNCLVDPNSGLCSLGTGNCSNDAGCTLSGTCKNKTKGTCSLPTNDSCSTTTCAGEKYCPVLNSCLEPMSASASASCAACSPWSIGPWGACVTGTQTRTVTCGGGTCCGSQPSSSQSCTMPSCSNGATNYPTCTTCPVGQTLIAGTCQPTTTCSGGNCHWVGEGRDVVDGGFPHDPAACQIFCASCIKPHVAGTVCTTQGESNCFCHIRMSPYEWFCHYQTFDCEPP